MSNLKVSDPYLWSILQNEKKKQKEVINLIASENYTSAAVLEAIGSVFVNKYTEDAFKLLTKHITFDEVILNHTMFLYYCRFILNRRSHYYVFE